MDVNKAIAQQQQQQRELPEQHETIDEVDFIQHSSAGNKMPQNNNNNVNNNNYVAAAMNKSSNHNNNNNRNYYDNQINSNAVQMDFNTNAGQQYNNNNTNNANDNNRKEHSQQEMVEQQMQNRKPNSNNNINNNNNNSKYTNNHKEAIATTKQPTKKNSAKERLSIFSFSRKISQKSKKDKQRDGSKDREQQQQQQQQQESVDNAKQEQCDENETPQFKTSNGLVINATYQADDDTTATATATATAPPTYAYAMKTQKLPTAAAVPIGTPPRQQKFAKTPSSTLARFLSSTYNAKKSEKQEQKRLHDIQKFNTYGGRRHRDRQRVQRCVRPFPERFKQSVEGDESHIDGTTSDNGYGVESGENPADHIIGNFVRSHSVGGGSCSELATLDSIAPISERHGDLGSRALRTLSRGLGKLWWKRSNSVDISAPDPEFKVSYLGNVLTGWAKGEGCVEKQLATLWRNYTQNTKPDVVMRLKVCASGLKATTRQHGLTEYWANRITHCCAPANYPRVFCWIYRHEGRKLKHELRCHAVLCSKEKIVQEINSTLKGNLELALREFKREKILKQNARLSLANAVYDNPSMPRRKILLSVGGNNYRPPMERSKSAPKLGAIEEAIGEEEGEEAEDTNEPEMRACCQRDSLYPAMTLGRRHCRRGHSIRRTGKIRSLLAEEKATAKVAAESSCKNHECNTKVKQHEAKQQQPQQQQYQQQQQELKPIKANALAIVNEAADANKKELRNSYGSDDSDDFDKLLKHNDYDSNASLAKELLPYFDLQLNKNKSSSCSSLHENACEALDQADILDDEGEPLSLLPTINCDPNAHPENDISVTDAESEAIAAQRNLVQMRRHGVCSDGEEEDDDYMDADDEDAEIRYFRQQSILSILHRNSMRKMTQLTFSSGEESSSIETTASTSSGVGTSSSGGMPTNEARPSYHHQVQSSVSSNASSNITSISSQMDHSDQQMGKQHFGQAHSKRETEQQQHQHQHQEGQHARKRINPDSEGDEGSISSGCETASTVTTPNQDDLSLQYRESKTYKINPKTGEFEYAASDSASNTPDSPVTVDEIYQRLESRLHGRNNSDATTFSSSSSITLKTSNSPATSLHELLSVGDGSEAAFDQSKVDTDTNANVNASSGTIATNRQATMCLRRSAQAPGTQAVGDEKLTKNDNCDTDSECSDESGYVEYPQRDKRAMKNAFATAQKAFKELTLNEAQKTADRQKPKLPPKPLSRRHLPANGTTV